MPAVLAVGFVRLSFLFLYRRLFLVHSRSMFDIVSLILIYVVVAWTTVFLLLLAFYCGVNFPIQDKPSGEIGPNCLNPTLIYLAYTASDFSLDILIWLLPMPIVCPTTMQPSV